MDLTAILTEYGLPGVAAQALGNAGGFSGAQFWRLEGPAGPLCLRRWPREHPSPQQLEQIHALLRHAAAACPWVPVPLKTHAQTTYVSRDGFLWELSPWMPGVADFAQRPSRPRLQAALTALAQFHCAAEDFPSPGRRSGPSPGIDRRSDQLQRWLSGELERLRQAIQPGVWPGLESLAQQFCRRVPPVAPVVAGLLAQAARCEVPLQPCLGDVWHDHVLFVEDRVTGLIDFGSVRIDSVAADVTRLLGSMAVDDDAQWAVGLEAYQAIRPLSGEELLLVRAFDQSTVLLAGLSWVEWIYKEKREFEAMQNVFSRLEGFLQRLDTLARQSADVNWDWS